MIAAWLVLGKDGMVGRAMMEQLGPRAVGLSRQECDFTDVSFLDVIDAAFTVKPFSVLINAAAYTRVDDAENEDSGTLLRINAIAPGELAAWCAKNGVVCVHFSTDYVFDGSGTHAWREDDVPAPLNAYGTSKLMGERAVAAVDGNYLIFRTSWVYAAQGKNFFTTMRQFMATRASLQVVADQVGAPTFAGHLAQGVVTGVENAMAQGEFPRGIYHLCHGGVVSWHGFADAILAHERAVNTELACQATVPVSTKDYGATAPRPSNSQLDCARAKMVLGVALPAWEVGLRACCDEHASNPLG